MKNKDYSLDLMRVSAMLLVIVIHLSNYYSRSFNTIDEINYMGATIFNALARISVPIFFMISGALLIGKVEDYTKYKKRVINFIITLALWTGIYFIWDITYMSKGISLYHAIYYSLFEPIKAHLWFMYAIIGLYIALPFIQNMMKNLDEKQENLFIKLWLFFNGAIYLLRLFMPGSDVITYPVPIIQGTYYLGYFVVGYILYKRKDKIKYSNNLLLYVFTITSLVTIIGTYISSIISKSYFEGLFAYRSLFIILSSISMYLIVLRKIKVSEKAKKLIDMISPYSFGVYLIHIIFFNILTTNINILNTLSVIGIPLYSLIIFIISYGAVYLLKKIPFIKNHI